jgi:gluconokinase
MSDALILTLDIGTSSARALVWDDAGQEAEAFRAQIPYAMLTTPDGGVEIEAETLLGYVAVCIDTLLHQMGERSRDIRGVGISTFWHSMLGVDAEGAPLTPIYIWADTRSAAQAERLRQTWDERRIHARTGCRIHPSYYPSKLLWLCETQPQTYRSVDRWVSPSEYLFCRLFGKEAMQVSVSMASGTGLMNQETCAWDSEVLRLLNLEEDRLSSIVDLSHAARGLRAEFANRWKPLKEVPFFPAVGDGACGNAGSGCVTPERFAINLGTSGAIRVLWRESEVTAPAAAPDGCWRYRIDRARPLMGAAFSDGGNVVLWMQQTLRLPSLEELESHLSNSVPGSHGITFLPFLAGERSMGWNPHARAALIGMNLDTSALEIAQAAMEAIAMRFALAANRLAEVFPQAREVIASGGALGKSPAWAQMFADALGRPIALAEEAEASSRGAAALVAEALEGADWRPWETQLGRAFAPESGRHARFQEMLEKQEDCYRRLIASGGEGQARCD